jgi:hypothetical protein
LILTLVLFSLACNPSSTPASSAPPSIGAGIQTDNRTQTSAQDEIKPSNSSELTATYINNDY